MSLGTRLGLVASIGIFSIFAFGSSAFGDDFFNITATGTSSTVSVNGANILHLTDNLINEENQFAALTGQNINASVKYAGMPGAILFSENAGQTSATLTIPSTGFTRTFTGTDSADLQHQIHDFLKQDGDSAYSAFLSQTNRNSSVAVVDGNPQASTALLATGAFSTFGLDSEAASAPGGSGALRVQAGGTYLRASGLNGTLEDLNLAFDIPFSKYVALTFDTVLENSNISGTNAYTAGEIVGLPIKLIPGHSQGPAWEITPWIFGGVGATYDEAAGTVVWGGGGTNSLVWRWNDFTFTLANQISYATDAGTTIDGFEFDVPVRSWILKNGVMASYSIAGGPLFIDGGGAYTNFLSAAGVPYYWSPTAGVGLSFGHHSNLRLSYEGDFGHSYHADGLSLMLLLNY